MPSETSRGSIDTALSKLDQRMKALKESRLRHSNEIIRIDHTLKEIEAEYRKIVNEASPLLNLPAEITCMIFDFYVTTYDYIKYPKFGAKVLLPEVVVSHVCKRWRGISLNYPQLWTTYCSRSDGFKTVGNPFDRFDTYMERSGSQNLELFFDFGGLPFDPRELFDKVLKLVKRWKTVTLLVEGRHVPPDLLMASAPNLEYFAYLLILPDHDPRPIRTALNSSDPRIFQGGAPKLRYLTLDCSSQTRLPQLSNITTLRIEADTSIIHAIHSWETYLEILTIPSLVNLSINGTISTVPQSKDIHVITMNNLKHLRYGFHRFMTLLLPFIRAPLLETLFISSDNAMSQQDFVANFGIPKDSYFFPSLQTLILIDSTASSPDSIWRVMQLTKNVTSLQISHNMDVENHFFDGLRKHGCFNDECWPKLTSLTANIYPYYCSDSITEFVLSRPKNAFMLRLSSGTDLEIQAETPDEYKEIQENCTVKVLTAEEETAFRPLWPPGVDCPEYASKHDPFHVDIAL